MKKQVSYPNYLHYLKQNDPTDLSDKLHPSSHLQHTLLSGLNRNIAGTYILDYTRSKYLYANERMSFFVDYPVSYILSGGLDFTLSIWHPEDLRLFNEKIFPANLKFFTGVPAGSHSDYLISCNFRVKNRQGDYISVLQQSVITHVSPDKLPLITLGFVTNISPWVKDSRIIHTIEAAPSAAAHQNSPLINETYFISEEDQLLSTREAEILKWVCEGLDSKQIAQKLSLSHHTVNNHRRNILRKTNSKKFLDLLHYAVRYKIL